MAPQLLPEPPLAYNYNMCPVGSHSLVRCGRSIGKKVALTEVCWVCWFSGAESNRTLFSQFGKPASEIRVSRAAPPWPLAAGSPTPVPASIFPWPSSHCLCPCLCVAFSSPCVPLACFFFIAKGGHLSRNKHRLPRREGEESPVLLSYIDTSHWTKAHSDDFILTRYICKDLFPNQVTCIWEDSSAHSPEAGLPPLEQVQCRVRPVGPALLQDRELSVASLMESSGTFCTGGDPQRQECCQLQ